MQVHRVELLIVDHDAVVADEITVVIENQKYPNRCIHPTVMAIETVEIGEWSDDHQINTNQRAEYERLFQKRPAQS